MEMNGYIHPPTKSTNINRTVKFWILLLQFVKHSPVYDAGQ